MLSNVCVCESDLISLKSGPFPDLKITSFMADSVLYMDSSSGTNHCLGWYCRSKKSEIIQHKILIYVNFITPLRICTDQQGVIDLVIAIDFSFPLNSVLDWICLLSLCTSLFNTFCPLTDKTVGKISSLQERERRTSTSSTMSTTSQVRADIRGIKVGRVIFLKDQQQCLKRKSFQ